MSKSETSGGGGGGGSTASGGDSTPFASKTWELNIYELNRIPHEIIYDDTEIAVSPKILQNELMCPICLDILKTTMTTKECLHRFCHDCIITALRAGNKECPTCRKKLISKRSLRRDPNFDGIIAKIYPNREEYDALHEKVLEKLNKKHLTSINNSSAAAAANNSTTNQTTTTSMTTTKSNKRNNQVNSSATTPATSSTTTAETNGAASKETTTRGGGVKRNVAAAAASSAHSDESDIESRTSTEQSSSHLQNDLDEIELVLKPHPVKETTLTSKRFLKTTSNATMNHLSKYLWTRLCVEAASTATSATATTAEATTPGGASGNDFQLFMSSNDKLPSSFQSLSQNLTLEQVIDKYWKQNRPIEIFYFNSKSSSASGANLNDLNSNSNSSSSAASTTSNASSTTNA